MPLPDRPLYQKLLLLCIGCGGFAWGVALLVDYFFIA